MIETLEVITHARTELVDITAQIQQLVSKSGVRDGVCHVFAPHTTAAVTINENADPSVQADLVMELDKIVPLQDHYAHTEGNSAAHIKASLVGNAVCVFIAQRTLVLGTWQGIYFCEFDGARRRKVLVKTVEDYMSSETRCQQSRTAM